MEEDCEAICSRLLNVFCFTTELKFKPFLIPMFGLKKEFIYLDVIEEARKIRKDWEEIVFDNFKKNLAIHEKALEWIKEH
ncbi:hypothetical protein ThvES_00008950 [Thiovulum sp. ES]|nr:hypothetical protein ThvES_00008950 [Thiovulum sp. ES]